MACDRMTRQALVKLIKAISLWLRIHLDENLPKTYRLTTGFRQDGALSLDLFVIFVNYLIVKLTAISRAHAVQLFLQLCQAEWLLKTR